MKIGYYIKKLALQDDSRIGELLGRLRSGGVGLYAIRSAEDVQEQTDMVLSFGGDGTFLSAAHRVAEAGIPILGVNYGRMGFLSENRAEDVVKAILGKCYHIEEQDVIKVESPDIPIPGLWPYAVNEVSIHRTGAEMLGVDVTLDSEALPTYWADGVLVATSTGSTAYSLSAGGPICLPSAAVRLITPIAPHNLNLRPLVIPASAGVTLCARSRTGTAVLTLDNRSYAVPAGAHIRIGNAEFRLRRVMIGKSNFIDALRSRFFWGQDVRNTSE